MEPSMNLDLDEQNAPPAFDPDEQFRLALIAMAETQPECFVTIAGTDLQRLARLLRR